MKIKKEYKKRINILFAGIIELSLFLKMNLYFQLLIYSSNLRSSEDNPEISWPFMQLVISTVSKSKKNVFIALL